MASTTHSARITGPLAYFGEGGRQQSIPLGPCLVEQGDGPLVDIVWGARGENSAALPIEVMTSAEVSGNLVLLD